MKEVITDRLRMYSLNMYNCSAIQCGIQSAHSNMEYALKYWGDLDFHEWSTYHKTVILLNGGTSNSGEYSPYNLPISKGSMETHLENLIKNGVKAVPFYEPDMNNAMTSISFLVDERVYNKVKYPDYETEIHESEIELLLNSLDYDIYLQMKDEGILSDSFLEWVESIGGESNLFLRFYLHPSKVRLSSN